MSYLDKALSLVNPADEVEGNCRYLYLARAGNGKTAAALEWAANELLESRKVLYISNDRSTFLKSKALHNLYPESFFFFNLEETYLPSSYIPWRTEWKCGEEISVVIDDFSACFHLIEQDQTLTDARENIRRLGSLFGGRMFITNTLSPHSGPDCSCPVDYAGGFEINRKVEK